MVARLSVLRSFETVGHRDRRPRDRTAKESGKRVAGRVDRPRAETNGKHASLIMIQKGPTTWQGLSILSSLVLWLDRGYVGRTRALLALSDLELDLLAFIQRCIACCLDLRVMDKQVIAAIVRGNKTISLA